MAAMVLIACADKASPPLAVEHYDKPLWTAHGDVVMVGQIRVLSDGRVIIADMKEKEVWLFDADGKPVRNLPSKGSGPNEFKRVQGLWALPGDSTLVYDDSQRRLLVLDEQARPVQTIALSSKISQFGLSGTPQTDARGRIIMQSSMMLDSTEKDVPLVRWDWRTDVLDTVARTAVPKRLVARTASSIIMYVVPFTPLDWVHPLPSGEIAIIRAATYHVDLVDSLGNLRRGDSVAFKGLPVTQAERDEEEPAMRGLLPSTKPPFNGYYAVVSNDGEMWVRRTIGLETDSLNYDVLNSNGTRLRTVRLGPRRWVLSVSRDRVYISRYNDDDFEVLDAFARK